MTKQLHYRKPNRLPLLHDELQAAGVAPIRVEGLADDVWLTVEGDQDEPTVQAVVAAHDPTAEGEGEALARAERALVEEALINMETYIDSLAPTTAETAAQTKLHAKLLRILMRHTLGSA